MWGVFAAVAAPCPSVVPAAQVSGRIESAMLSYATLEPEAFERSADEATAMAACVAEPLDRSLVGGLHRVRGMRALLLDDPGKAAASFVAAVRADPSYVLPSAVAPEGGPLAEAWAAAKGSTPAPTAPVDLPVGLAAWVDGVPGAPRPTIGPYWLQVQGRSWATTWVVEGPPDSSELPLPGAVVAGPPPAPIAPAPMPAAPAPMTDLETHTAGARRGSRPLLVGALVTGVAAGGLYGTAAGARLGYAESPTPGRYTLINSTYLASVGTGVVSAALFGGWLSSR